MSLTLYFKVLYMRNSAEEDLFHIRNIMEKSTRFLSLSGLSGISAGIVALVGAGFAWKMIGSVDSDAMNPGMWGCTVLSDKLIMLLGIIFVAAVGLAVFFTVRKSRKNYLKIWTSVSKHFLINLFVPLFAGGIFCIALWHAGVVVMLGSAMLIFYGLALLNASKYTFAEINKLGYLEILLGLVSLFFPGYGLVFWTIGFGLLHIIYGAIMYVKYH